MRGARARRPRRAPTHGRPVCGYPGRPRSYAAAARPNPSAARRSTPTVSAYDGAGWLDTPRPAVLASACRLWGGETEARRGNRITRFMETHEKGDGPTPKPRAGAPKRVP